MYLRAVPSWPGAQDWGPGCGCTGTDPPLVTYNDCSDCASSCHKRAGTEHNSQHAVAKLPSIGPAPVSRYVIGWASRLGTATLGYIQAHEVTRRRKGKTAWDSSGDVCRDHAPPNPCPRRPGSARLDLTQAHELQPQHGEIEGGIVHLGTQRHSAVGARGSRAG